MVQFDFSCVSQSFSHAKAQSRKECSGFGLQPKSQKNEKPIPLVGIGFSFFCGFGGSEGSIFAALRLCVRNGSMEIQNVPLPAFL
jgi:hypothetical protein